MKKFLAELAHHLVAHPVWGVTIAVCRVARAAERAAERLNAATADVAWPEDRPR
jgi:hypothetical protein